MYTGTPRAVERIASTTTESYRIQIQIETNGPRAICLYLLARVCVRVPTMYAYIMYI